MSVHKFTEELEKNIVGQKRTGKNKQFVLLYENYAVKGPYNEEKLKILQEREEILKKLNVKHVVLSVGLADFDIGKFVVFPTFLKFPLTFEEHKESFSNYSYKINTSKQTISLREALENDNELFSQMSEVIYELCILYLLEVGDTGHRNIQYSLENKKFYIIDIDETKTTDRDDLEFYFSRNTAASLNWLENVKKFYHDIAKKILKLKELKLFSEDRIDKAITLLMSENNSVWKGMKAGSETSSGIPFDIAKSALQKWIRRCETVKALMIAKELYKLGEVGGTAPITNTFNRVDICAAEDIGLSNFPLVLAVLNNKNRDLDSLLSKVEPLAESSKTRICSHLWYVFNNDEGRKKLKNNLKNENIRIKIEKVEDFSDLLSDFPNLSKAGQILEKFEKCLLEQDFNAYYLAKKYLSLDLPKVSKTKKLSTGKSYTTLPTILLWKILQKFLPLSGDILTENYYEHTENRPFLALAILAAIVKVDSEPCELRIKEYTLPEHPLIVDDYAIDKHTALGRKLGKNIEDFVKEGAKVEKQDLNFYCPVLEEIYQSKFD